MNNEAVVNTLQNLLQHPVQINGPLYNNNENPFFIELLKQENINEAIVSFLRLDMSINGSENLLLQNVMCGFRYHTFLGMNADNLIKNISYDTWDKFLRTLVNLPFQDSHLIENKNALIKTYLLVIYMLNKDIDKMVELMYNGDILYKDFGVHSFINLFAIDFDVKKAFIIRYLNMIRNGEIEWIPRSQCQSWFEDINLTSNQNISNLPRNYQESICFAWLLEQENLPNNLNLEDIYPENIVESIINVM